CRRCDADFGHGRQPARMSQSDSVPAVSVVIIAQDEEPRIARSIESCRSFSDEILVVDGGSRDRTPEVARELGCRLVKNPWPGYVKQRNFGASAAANNWIFVLDADEVIGEDLQASLLNWKSTPPTDASAYTVLRIGDFLGRWLGSS